MSSPGSVSASDPASGAAATTPDGAAAGLRRFGRPCKAAGRGVVSGRRPRRATGGFQVTTGAAVAALTRVAVAAAEVAHRQAVTLTAEAVVRKVHGDRE